MCGIFGLISEKPAVLDISPGLTQLRHRGPDDEGMLFWSPGERPVLGQSRSTPCRVALGHRRLSIIDLSSAGHQPMSSADGRWHLVFNGEVYNYLELRDELAAEGHSFRSHTDTEVVLQALATWGPRRALPRFTGMFALALLDTVEGTVLLARDPFGIKPLFFCHWSGGMAFSSEIAPLLELPGVSRKLNPTRTYQYLRFGITDHGRQTMLSGIQQLTAACWCRFEINKPRDLAFEQYWHPERIEPIRMSFREAAQKVRETFLNSIRLHLRSDVPVGIALSGGIDSSAIVCAVRHLNPNQEIHTFSYIAEDERISEEKWVDIVSQSAQTVAHKVKPGIQHLVEDLTDLVRVQGEPTGSTSIYAQYRVFRLAQAAGIKVMLDGQGADEILGGYTPYQGVRLSSLVRQGHWIRALRLALAQSKWGRSPNVTLKHAIRDLLPTSLVPHAKKMIGKSDIPPWVHTRWFLDRGVRLADPFWAKQGRDRLRAELIENLTESSVPHLLRHEDRNSMAFSIESRVPFLTTELAELLLALPEDFLIDDNGTSKCVFRAAMRGIMPDAILDRKDKIGFQTPELKWFQTMSPWVKETLALARDSRVIDHDTSQAEWDGILAGTRPFGWHIWRIMNFLKWKALFNIEE